MHTELQIIVALTLYKIVSLCVGTAFAFMGYKLFVAGVWGESGDVEAQFRDNKLVVKRAAPGTFFVLFGAIIVCSAVFTKLTFQTIPFQKSTESYIEIKINESDELPEKLPF
ncbi:MAG: hypothetical protein ACSHX0_12845 [Akkermansiaceae bacterium]